MKQSDWHFNYSIIILLSVNSIVRRRPQTSAGAEYHLNYCWTLSNALFNRQRRALYSNQQYTKMIFTSMRTMKPLTKYCYFISWQTLNKNNKNKIFRNCWRMIYFNVVPMVLWHTSNSKILWSRQSQHNVKKNQLHSLSSRLNCTTNAWLVACSTRELAIIKCECFCMQISHVIFCLVVLVFCVMLCCCNMFKMDSRMACNLRFVFMLGN